MAETERSHFDCNQNFWQLASISGAALGLPAMVVGGQLAREYGAGTAIISVCIGNVLLWIIGLGIISMTQGRNHAIENVKGYLGKNVSIFTALIWILAFLFWYSIQIKGASDVIGELFPSIKRWQIGAFFGIFAAGLSIGGIRTIKRVCVIGLPLLFCYIIYAIATSQQTVLLRGTWGVSFSGILSVLLIWLPGIVNLPTLFRHSSSKDDSVLGLCLMAGFHALLQISSIFIGIDNYIGIVSKYADNGVITVGLILTICFVCLSFLCINLVNIYFASAGWEAIIFRHKSAKEYVIVGLAGTATYLLGDNLTSFSFHVLEVSITSFIASLGAVLIIDVLIRMIVRHRPRPLEKFISNVCWFVGCLASLIVQAQTLSGASNGLEYANDPLLTGILASSMAFLIVLFVEETTWSIKSLPKNV